MSHRRKSADEDDALPEGSTAIKDRSETPPGISFVWTEKQLLWWEAVRSGQYRFMAVGGAIRGGKQLDLNTPIPTPGGWTTMGALEVGDRIFSDSGVVCRVTALTEVDPEPESYRLTFDDGSTIDACADHQWVTFTRAERIARKKRTPEYRAVRRLTRPSRATFSRGAGYAASLSERNAVLVPPTKPAPTGAVRTTAEIFRTLRDGKHANHSIPLAGALVTPQADLPVDPYALGVWLGDGTSTTGQIASNDPEIIAELAKLGYDPRKLTGPYMWGTRGLYRQLRLAGLLGNKHVPVAYFRASQEQRLALLQGLLDTDGTVSDGGAVEFCNTNRVLADAVVDLIRSLGGKAHVRERRARLNGRDCGPCYTVKFAFHLPAFRLRRKLDRQRLRSESTRWHYIVGCERIAPVPMRCITVDSPSHLYLAGRSLVPTHNTFTVLATVFLLMRMYPRSRWAIIRMDLPTLRRTTMVSVNKMRDTVGGFLSPINMTAWEYTASNGSKLILFPESIEEDPELERFNGLEVNGFILEEANELSVKTKNKCIQRAGAWIIPPDADQAVAVAKAVRDGMDQREANKRFGPKQPLPFLFLTFNPADNWVREEIYEPYEAGTLEAPWYYQPMTILDNPYLTDEYKESLLELKRKDPDSYARFVEGKWGVIRAPNQLITSDMLKQARLVPEIPGVRREGMDVARYGKDATVHAAVDGNCLTEIEEIFQQGITEGATHLTERVTERGVSASNVTVDVVGLGAGIADNCRSNGIRVNEFVAGARPHRRIIGFREAGGVLLKQRSFYKFADLWSQAWWEFKEKLERGEVSIRAKHPRLVRELTAPRYTITNKVIKVESSEDITERIGLSPDVGVAIVLAFFDFPLKDETSGFARTTSRRRLAR